jgi:HAD superfamily hydrolase (TIGR01509 family)
MPIRAVFFDAGGTLIHPDRRFILDRVAERGLDRDDADWFDAQRYARDRMHAMLRSGEPADDAARWRVYLGELLLRLGCSPADAAFVGEAIRARHREGLLWTFVEEGTAALLDALRAQGRALGVVSNADGRVAGFLDRAGLLDRFDFVVDSALVGVEKPDPRIFQVALHHAGVAPAEAMHVGDLYDVDVLGARRAGLAPVLLDPDDRYGGADCPRVRGLPELLVLLSADGRDAGGGPGPGHG